MYLIYLRSIEDIADKKKAKSTISQVPMEIEVSNLAKRSGPQPQP